MDNNKKFLHKAIEIASDGIQAGGGPFGAVIVKNGQIISGAFNRVVLDSDPTAHAEILAIRQAAAGLKSHELSDCTLYSSCEPCPMCMGAIYWSGIKQVVYSSDRIDAEEAGFSDNFIYEEIMLDPARRKIEFLRMITDEGKEVFRLWSLFENKIKY